MALPEDEERTERDALRTPRSVRRGATVTIRPEYSPAFGGRRGQVTWTGRSPRVGELCEVRFADGDSATFFAWEVQEL